MSIRSRIELVGTAAHNPASPEDRDWVISNWVMRDGIGVTMYDPDKGTVSGWPYRDLWIIAEVNRIAGHFIALELANTLRDRDKVTHDARENKIKDLQRQIDELKEEAR